MSFLDRIRSLLRGDRPAPDRSHTPDPSPAFPTQPTIAQQVETLESLGLRLRDPLTVAAVEHTVARGVTPDQLTSTAAPAPSRRTCAPRTGGCSSRRSWVAARSTQS